MNLLKRIPIVSSYFSKSNENPQSKIESTVVTPIEEKYKKNLIFQYIREDLAGRKVSLINAKDETIVTGKIICIDSKYSHDDTEITIKNEQNNKMETYKGEKFTYIQFHKDGIVTLDDIIKELNKYKPYNNGGKSARKNKTRKAKISKRRKSNKRK
jgi:flagellar hook assembly protein FlgD